MRINVEYVGLGNQTGEDTKEGNKNCKRTGKIYIRRKMDEMWINKFGKEKNKERPRSIQDYDWKGSNIGTRSSSRSAWKAELEVMDKSYLKNKLGHGGID